MKPPGDDAVTDAAACAESLDACPRCPGPGAATTHCEPNKQKESVMVTKDNSDGGGTD